MSLTDDPIELRNALEQSVKLQSFYAQILNQYDIVRTYASTVTGRHLVLESGPRSPDGRPLTK